MKKSNYLILSVILGICFTALSGFIGQSSVFVEPEGVSHGWRGLPIPYYEEGVLGDSFHILFDCSPISDCYLPIIGELAILIIDVTFWSLLAYLTLRIIRNKRPKSPNTAYPTPL